ncbi:MAG: hypothetical protein ACWGO1_15790, partial [Anaerolineales bacterium]
MELENLPAEQAAVQIEAEASAAATAVNPTAPLLNNTLRLFMVTMVLANIAGHMYEPLLPLY